MHYFCAIFLPPVGIALCGRWGHCIVNAIFWLISLPLLFFGVGVIGWLLCATHALSICRMTSIDKRIDRVVKAIEGRSEQQTVEN